MAIPQASDLDRAIELQYGPFRDFYFMDEDDPRNILHLFDDGTEWCGWGFKRGILPRYAEDLINDEWSYYLGFDGSAVDPRTLCRELKGDISPRRALFEIVASNPCVYLIGADDGWWEAFTTIDEIRNSIVNAWGERITGSKRWGSGRLEDLYPAPFPKSIG